MISLVDISLQNPIANLAADSGFLRLLPAYGAMQAATTAGFSPVIPVADLVLQLARFAGLACLGPIVFLRRTRDRAQLRWPVTGAAEPAQ